MGQLVEHAEKEHKFNVLSENINRRYFKSSIDIKNCFEKSFNWSAAHFKFKDQHFFRECWRSTGGLWSIWVYAIGSMKDCEKHAYTMKIFADDKHDKEQLIYHGHCVPFDLAKEQVAEQGKCLTLTDAAVKRYISNDKLYYSLIIK